MIDMRMVKKKFYSHKGGAKTRGIPFNLTFEQWWDIWRPHWHNRGSKRGQFVMCRTMDQGGYEVGNVRIDTVKGNGHTRALVNYDALLKEARLVNIVEVEEPHDEQTEFEEDWLPKHLKGFRQSKSFGF